jgi:hypothetical protein
MGITIWYSEGAVPHAGNEFLGSFTSPDCKDYNVPPNVIS